MLEPRCEATLQGHDDAILALDVYDPAYDVLAPEQQKGQVHRGSGGWASDGRGGRCLSGGSVLCATGGADSVVVVWDVTKGGARATLRGHAHGVLSAQFVTWPGNPGKAARPGNGGVWGGGGSGGGGGAGLFLWLVTGSVGKSVRLWDPLSGR